MKTSTKWLIGGGILAAAAATWYVIANMDNDDILDENGDKKEKPPAIPAPSTPMVKPLANIPQTPFLNASEGNAFRGWVNDKDPAYAKSINLDRTGAYDNSYIRKAYSKYGIEYEKFRIRSAEARYDAKQKTEITNWIGKNFYANKQDVSVYTYPKTASEFLIKTFKLSDVLTKPIGVFMGVSAEPGWYKAAIVFANKMGGNDAKNVYIPANQISKTTV